MVVRFNVQSIPSSATVKNAVLSLYAVQDYTGSSGEGKNGAKTLYPLTTRWTKDSLFWSKPWKVSGGDFATGSGVRHPGTAVKVWEDFDVTKLVAGHVKSAATNHGFIIKFDANTPPCGLEYCSSTDTTTPDLRPKLTVTYDAPISIIPSAQGGSRLMARAVRGGVLLTVPTTTQQYRVTLTDARGKQLSQTLNSQNRQQRFIEVPQSMARGILFLTLQSGSAALTDKIILTE